MKLLNKTKLNSIKLSLLASSLLVTQIAFAQSAGTVTFKTGDVSITRADKTVIKAEKNVALNAGDTIETGDGRLQLSLIDGGKVSLQPNTIYKINKYEFSGKEDGTEYGFTELVKGGLRTISGLIGHKNRDRYQLKTAVATIGIRGTEFSVNFNDNNLLMTTNHGSVDVCNQGGCLNAVTGQSIEVAGPGAAPKPSSKKAKAAAAPPASNKAVFAAGESIDVAALTPTTPTEMPIETPTLGSDTIVSLATMQAGLDNNGIYIGTPNLSGNTLTDYVDSSGSTTIIPGTIKESGTDGGLKFGRASGGTYNGQPMLMTTWIVGSAAPAGALTGLVGTYNVGSTIGSSTAPYMVNNNAIIAVGTPNSVTGNLNINFSQYSFTYTLNVPIAGTIHSVASSGSLIAGSAKFRDIGSSMGLLSGSSIVEGSLYGANAQVAGLQYGFNVSGSGVSGSDGNVYGAVILK